MKSNIITKSLIVLIIIKLVSGAIYIDNFTEGDVSIVQVGPGSQEEYYTSATAPTTVSLLGGKRNIILTSQSVPGRVFTASITNGRLEVSSPSTSQALAIIQYKGLVDINAGGIDLTANGKNYFHLRAISDINSEGKLKITDENGDVSECEFEVEGDNVIEKIAFPYTHCIGKAKFTNVVKIELELDLHYGNDLAIDFIEIIGQAELASASATTSITVTASASSSPSPSSSASRSQSISSSLTPSPSASPSASPSSSSSSSLSPSPSITVSSSPSSSLSPSSSSSITLSSSPSSSVSFSPSVTPTATPSATMTVTSSSTKSSSLSPSMTKSLSPSKTVTKTPTRSFSSTRTPPTSRSPTRLPRI